MGDCRLNPAHPVSSLIKPETRGWTRRKLTAHSKWFYHPSTAVLRKYIWKFRNTFSVQYPYAMEGSLPKIPFGINGRAAQTIFKILNVSINTAAQRVKALAAKSEDLSSIPWIHTPEGGDQQRQAVLPCPHAGFHLPTHNIRTHNKQM